LALERVYQPTLATSGDVVKIKKIKKIVIGSEQLDIVWDKTSYAASFSYKHEV
jgi:hypothetical protein